ncbi:MAG: Gfo/Idh/MocA family oxidoreductase [Devosia sp.]
MKTVGVLGVGSIADVYVHNMRHMPNCRIVAVAARDTARTQQRASDWNVSAETPAGLIARNDIDVILNLTPPLAHFETTRAALIAGKHVFSEKPLGITVAEAQALSALAAEAGLRLGVAPDTVFGAGLQKAREMIDAGMIGRPLMASASILYHGADGWHPNPAFFYRAAGGGPIHDVGPYFIAALASLFGPIGRVTARAFRGFETRTITAEGPEKGMTVPVEVPTSVLSLLSFRSGLEATLSASWDVWKTGQPPIEVHGTLGSLQLPHPAWHGGPLKFARPNGDWEIIPVEQSILAQHNWPPDNPSSANYRGIGLAEMIDALERGEPHRLSAEFATHVVEAADAIIASADADAAMSLALSPQRPAPIDAGDIARLIDAAPEPRDRR